MTWGGALTLPVCSFIRRTTFPGSGAELLPPPALLSRFKPYIQVQEVISLPLQYTISSPTLSRKKRLRAVSQNKHACFTIAVRQVEKTPEPAWSAEDCTCSTQTCCCARVWRKKLLRTHEASMSACIARIQSYDNAVKMLGFEFLPLNRSTMEP